MESQKNCLRSFESRGCAEKLIVASDFDIKKQSRLIFTEALQAVDAFAAIGDAVDLSEKSILKIVNENYDLTRISVYAIAIGKAAYPMACAIDKILGDKLKAGIVSGVFHEQPTEKSAAGKQNLSAKWRKFAGGHPLPNKASLAAAESCFDLLRRADDKNSLIIFLISGGGSAMVEATLDKNISLAALRETNLELVTCGTSISEINKIRKALSSIKGGGLASFAPEARQVTLIISDTEAGDESSVASGPTLRGEESEPEEIASIIKRYDLPLPPAVLNALKKTNLKRRILSQKTFPYYVLLDNQSVVDAAAKAAGKLEYAVEIAPDISQQNIAEGCAELLARAKNLRSKTGIGKISCLISGGEFACQVRGNGVGGRNSETVLRMAMLFEEYKNYFSNVAFISAGTDGIDGNSPAAGAVCDKNTLEKAERLGLDARRYLENSDSYNFFKSLGDDLTIGATGTNVRDLRIVLVAGNS